MRASHVLPAMLDPTQPDEFRVLAHRMLDDALDGLEHIGDGPTWRAIPADVKEALAEHVPVDPTPLGAVYAAFRAYIEPFENGNRQPSFVGWVHGNGTPSGMLAEMLAAALNANAGGREHSAVYVERAVLAWSAQIFGFPPTAGGILTSGTSLATLIAMIVARTAAAGAAVRIDGLRGRPLTGYAARGAHRSIASAFDVTGLGRAALREVATDAQGAMDMAALEAGVARDRAAGDMPFAVIATAGSVDRGAIDPLEKIAAFCARERLWMHVDGAFGALAVLSPEHAHRLRGIERADSLAFDYHKWLHVPYDAGCVLFRDAALQLAAFTAQAPYLRTAPAGTAAGEPWYSELGPELSRRFRALAIWFAFKEHGTRRLGAAIARNCQQAARLGREVEARIELVLGAPVVLNIVCLRFWNEELSAPQADALNAAIVVDLQTRGIAVPSTTIIDGRCVIRINLTNHRITDQDLDRLLDAIVASGQRLLAAQRGAATHA